MEALISLGAAEEAEERSWKEEVAAAAAGMTWKAEAEEVEEYSLVCDLWMSSRRSTTAGTNSYNRRKWMVHIVLRAAAAVWEP